MKFLANQPPKKQLLLLLVALGCANVLVWGAKWVVGFPQGALHSTGTAFATDGTVLRFSDKIEFKGESFNVWVKVNWNGKSNAMHEVGSATHGAWGELDVTLEDSSSFGPSLLSEIELDDEVLFARSSMQGGRNKLSLLPLSGEFNGQCYYLLYMKKVYCGSEKSSTPLR